VQGVAVQALTRGRYRARLAKGEADLHHVQALRHLVFRQRRGLAATGGLDTDRFDALCQHVLIENLATGALLGCFRVAELARTRRRWIAAIPALSMILRPCAGWQDR
jgi:putative hemolysin